MECQFKPNEHGCKTNENKPETGNSELLLKHIEGYLDQQAQTVGWIIASLLAINGGALLAMLNQIELVVNPVPPAAAFVAGLASALLTAVFTQNAASKAIRILQRNESGDATEEAKKHKRFAPYLALFSGAAFIFGVVALGMALTSSLENRRAVCMGLQRDMLSTNPKREDSRELFETLRCQLQARAMAEFRQANASRAGDDL